MKLTKIAEAVYLKIRSIKREILHETDTWWDNRNYKFMRDEFLRSGIDDGDGINNPSRVFLRTWLKNHPNLRMLDIPCANGVEYEGIQKNNIPVKYMGMDFSDTMIRVFKERFPHAKVKKGAIQSIPLKNNSFDLVLCRHILEHLPDYRPAIAEAIRVSKKYVIIILFRKPFKSVRKEIGWGAWDNRLNLKELKEYLKIFKVRVHITKTLPPKGTLLEENTILVITKT